MSEDERRMLNLLQRRWRAETPEGRHAIYRVLEDAASFSHDTSHRNAYRGVLEEMDARTRAYAATRSDAR